MTNRPWFSLMSQVAGSSTAHALLFQCVEEGGLTGAAKQFAQSRLCKQNSFPGCENCHSCSLFATGAHPDFFLVEKEQGKKSIGINQIRELCEKLNQTPQVSQRQFAVVDLADDMTVEAANALLKTLEEPSGNTELLLLSNHLFKLPVTIKSRCQLWDFTPSEEQIIEWLQAKTQASIADIEKAVQLSLQKPLVALGLLTESESYRYLIEFSIILGQVAQLQLNPIQSVAKLENNQLITYLDLIYSFVAKSLSTGNATTDFEQNLKNIDTTKRFSFIKEIIELKKDALSKANISPQLLLENVMLKWQELF